MARPRDGDRQHRRGQQDGNQLVGLGVNQERIRGHVLDEVVRHIGWSAAAAERVEDERDPARHGGQAGDDHEARLEAQGTQGKQSQAGGTTVFARVPLPTGTSARLDLER